MVNFPFAYKHRMSFTHIAFQSFIEVFFYFYIDCLMTHLDFIILFLICKSNEQAQHDSYISYISDKKCET
jgi:hypothetical protein